VRPARRRESLLAIFVVFSIASLALYSTLITQPTGLLWDDEGHLTRADLTPLGGLWRIWFTVGATQQYYPLLHSAFWLQSHLWGSSLPGYHAVNALLHAASAVILVGILRRLAVPGALLAGALFLVHPVEVESVAWISELKNTLSGVFFFGAAAVYLRFDETRGRTAYVAATALFICGVLTKSVTATLPAVLAIVLWYRRGRIDLRRDVTPLTPWLIGAVAAGTFTAWFEHSVIGANAEDFAFTPIERGLIAGRALWFYAVSIVWPASLSFNYPRWTIDAGQWWQYLFPAAIAALFGVLAWRRAWAALTFATVFAVILAPALGFVNVYPFRFSFVADHFQYHASAALLAAIAAALAAVAARLRLGGGTAIASAALLLVTLGAVTYQQTQHYVDAMTLYQATIAANPRSWLAHNNLASLFLTQGTIDPRRAAEHARQALDIEPDRIEARFNLGIALEESGDFTGATDAFRRVVASGTADGGFPRRRLAAAHRHLGTSLARAGRIDEGVTALRTAASIEPSDAAIRADLGSVLAAAGRPQDALAEFQAARAIEPSSPLHHTNIGSALLQLGRPEEAIGSLTSAIRLDPMLTDAYHNLGIAYALTGRNAEAAAAFREVLVRNPGDERARRALTAILARGK